MEIKKLIKENRIRLNIDLSKPFEIPSELKEDGSEEYHQLAIIFVLLEFVNQTSTNTIS